MNKQRSILMLLVLATMFSCKDRESLSPGRVMGYKPIYSTDAELFQVKTLAPRPVVTAGKIYVKDNYIFQNEVGEGIHVINNANPAAAQRTAFIQIKGSQELSIKGNFLYSNNFNDLVVIDISNISAVTEVKRLKNAFANGVNQLLPPGGSYFECTDYNKGIVVGWTLDSLDNPKCRN